MQAYACSDRSLTPSLCHPLGEGVLRSRQASSYVRPHGLHSRKNLTVFVSGSTAEVEVVKGSGVQVAGANWGEPCKVKQSPVSGQVSIIECEPIAIESGTGEARQFGVRENARSSVLALRAA